MTSDRVRLGDKCWYCRKTVGLGSSVGHRVVRSHLTIEEASQESFIVEAGARLQLTPDSTPHQGDVTLKSSILLPAWRFDDERDDELVVMSGNIALQGGGQIAETPIVHNPFDLTGNITGYGSLIFKGGGPQRYFGEIAINGDLILGDRGVVELVGLVEPFGDFILSKGNQGAPGSGIVLGVPPTARLAGTFYYAIVR